MGSIPTLGSKVRRYSRLASVEERRNLKRAIWFVVLTIGVGLGLFFIGIPILGRFVGFISNIGHGDTPISINDKTPPAPPKFDTFSEFTNVKTADLSGSSEPSAKIKLVFNNKEELETVVDKDGHFSFSDISLNDGANSFFATAQDTAGNVSIETKNYSITYDAKPPDLNIDNPGDGSQFFGSKERQVSIQGTTESGAQVTVNDRIVVVEDSGKFQYTTSLSDGENKFNVKAVDHAGNSTEKELTLSFSP